MLEPMELPDGLRNGPPAAPSVMRVPGVPDGPYVLLEWNSARPPGNMICWLAGEPFLLEIDLSATGDCRITHHHWSLCGFGTDFPSALTDLKARAVAIAPAYTVQPDDRLTLQARRLRDFLLHLVPTSDRDHKEVPA